MSRGRPSWLQHHCVRRHRSEGLALSVAVHEKLHVVGLVYQAIDADTGAGELGRLAYVVTRLFCLHGVIVEAVACQFYDV